MRPVLKLRAPAQATIPTARLYCAAFKQYSDSGLTIGGFAYDPLKVALERVDLLVGIHDTLEMPWSTLNELRSSPSARARQMPWSVRWLNLNR